MSTVPLLSPLPLASGPPSPALAHAATSTTASDAPRIAHDRNRSGAASAIVSFVHDAASDGDQLLQRERRVRRILELRAVSDQAARQDVADVGALLSGSEVRGPRR